MSSIAILAGSLAAPVLVSYLVERARSAPSAPGQLPWAPGEGPTLVLLHTLRTQLDMFQRVIPELARRFRVYALDYPGHGYSDIPKADYSAEYFISAVARFLDASHLRRARLEQ